MYDWTDYYLNRNIKNWIAHFQPPVEGKQKLLRAAHASPVHRNRRFFHLLDSIKLTLTNQPIYHSTRANVYVPYSQSSLWSFHFSTYWHLAH